VGWFGELIEAWFNGLVDDRLRDLLALGICQNIVEPVVADCCAESGLSSGKKFVVCPVRKGRRREELGFGAIAISRMAGEEPGDPEGLYSETKETCDVQPSSWAMR